MNQGVSDNAEWTVMQNLNEFKSVIANKFEYVGSFLCKHGNTEVGKKLCIRIIKALIKITI